jgi:hypothetical protein
LDHDSTSIQNAVDGGIEAGAPANLTENGSRNSHQRSAFVCHRKDRACPLGEHGTLGCPSERVDCLGVEN